MKVKTIGAAMVAAFAVGNALAGECPADQRVPDGQGQKMVTHAAKGLTDEVRASTDLAKEPAGIQGRLFRLRELNLAPGGIVPWHSHNERPAMIYIVSGEIVEYASNCAVPIVHRAGDVAPEKNGTSHWWQNHRKQPSKLISVDIFPVADKVNERTM